MKNIKKLVALGLVGVMVIGSSVTTFAAIGDEGSDVTATGQGANVSIATEVYSITVPTQDTIDKLFDYDVDPQGLVAKTAGARYGDGVTVGTNTGVIFPNYNEDLSKVVGVSDTSDPLVITNKSSKGVKLDIESKYVKGSATYAGDFSTTSDFSGTGDDAKGIYFGIKQSGDLEHFVDETGIGGSATTYEFNAVRSSADQYETKATAGTIGGANTYTFTLKDGAKDFATYEFVLTGQLNDDMPEATWYDVADHGVTAKTFGTVSVKFTPSMISSKTAYDKHGIAVIRPSDGIMIIGKAEENGHPAGDLDDETKPAAVIINEKGSGFAPATANAGGFGIVLWSEVLTAYGYSGDDYAIGTDNATELMNKLQTVTFTYGGNKYYADVIVAQF
jgi:hypothetical protein